MAGDVNSLPHVQEKQLRWSEKAFQPTGSWVFAVYHPSCSHWEVARYQSRGATHWVRADVDPPPLKFPDLGPRDRASDPLAFKVALCSSPSRLPAPLAFLSHWLRPLPSAPGLFPALHRPHPPLPPISALRGRSPVSCLSLLKSPLALSPHPLPGRLSTL